MKIFEAYQAMAKASGIKKGDKVKVLRMFQNHEMGCGRGTLGDFDTYVGKEGVVTYVNRDGDIFVSFEGAEDRHFFPFFVLEKLTPQTHTISIDGKDIEISHESFVALKGSLIEENNQC